MVHKLILVGEIFVAVIASLVTFGLVMTTIRALINGHFVIDGPFTSSDETTAELRASREAWWHKSLVAFDQFFNVFLLNGYPDETISAHAWRKSKQGKWWAVGLSRWLSWIQPNHGAKAAAGDRYRAITVAAIESQALGIK